MTTSIGHELEIVGQSVGTLDGEFSSGIGDTGGSVIGSLVGLGVFALALYGFSIYAGEKGWF